MYTTQSRYAITVESTATMASSISQFNFLGLFTEEMFTVPLLPPSHSSPLSPTWLFHKIPLSLLHFCATIVACLAHIQHNSPSELLKEYPGNFLSYPKPAKCFLNPRPSLFLFSMLFIAKSRIVIVKLANESDAETNIQIYPRFSVPCCQWQAGLHAEQVV